MSVFNNCFGDSLIQQGSNVKSWDATALRLIDKLKSTFSADGTISDTIGTNSVKLTHSSCLYATSTVTFTLPFYLNLDSDFSIEFSVKPDATLTDGNAFYQYNGTKGLIIRVIRDGAFQVFVRGTINANTSFPALSTSVFTRVKVTRVGSTLTVFYNNVSQGTINLTTYGSITNTINATIPVLLYKMFNIRISQTGISAHYPCADGAYSTASPLRDSSNPSMNATTTSNAVAGGVTSGGYQNDYHYNFINGFTLYRNTTYGIAIRVPYISGVPQNISLPSYNSVTCYKAAECPPYSLLTENNLLFNANSEGITDSLQLYFDGTNTSKEIALVDLLPSYKNRIFVDRSSVKLNKIVGFNSDQNSKALTGSNNKPFEFWILAGQSNAGNVGTLSEIDTTYKVFDYRSRFWNTDKYLCSDPFWGTHQSTNDKTTFSINLPFSKMRSDKGIETLFLQKFVSGVPIYNDGTTNNWNINTSGGIYSTFITQLDAAIAWLNARNIPYIFKGMIWYQGAQDATDLTYKNAFKANTIALINAIRTHLNFQIPVFQGKLAVNDGTYSADIRSLQSEIAAEVASCYLIDTDGFSFKADNAHLSSTGTIQFAAALDAMSYILSIDIDGLEYYLTMNVDGTENYLTL